jgi:3' exoribonuclease, RNase T-like
MIAFLDTEFTDLVVQPRLLSVGLVAGIGSGREFYAEVTDTDRLHATGWFGLGAVLPQFGKVAHAACTYPELGTRLATFLGHLAATVDTAECVDLAYGHHLDWELLELAIQDSGARHWESTRRRLRPVDVYGFAGFGPGKLAAEAYFKSQAPAPFSRHHALCDARALRVAYEAATRATAGPALPRCDVGTASGLAAVEAGGRFQAGADGPTNGAAPVASW